MENEEERTGQDQGPVVHNEPLAPQPPINNVQPEKKPNPLANFNPDDIYPNLEKKQLEDGTSNFDTLEASTSKQKELSSPDIPSNLTSIGKESGPKRMTRYIVASLTLCAYIITAYILSNTKSSELGNMTGISTEGSPFIQIIGTLMFIALPFVICCFALYFFHIRKKRSESANIAFGKPWMSKIGFSLVIITGLLLFLILIFYVPRIKLKGSYTGLLYQIEYLGMIADGVSLDEVLAIFAILLMIIFSIGVSGVLSQYDPTKKKNISIWGSSFFIVFFAIIPITVPLYVRNKPVTIPKSISSEDTGYKPTETTPESFEVVKKEINPNVKYTYESEGSFDGKTSFLVTFWNRAGDQVFYTSYEVDTSTNQIVQSTRPPLPLRKDATTITIKKDGTPLVDAEVYLKVTFRKSGDGISGAFDYGITDSNGSVKIGLIDIGDNAFLIQDKNNNFYSQAYTSGVNEIEISDKNKLKKKYYYEAEE